MTDTKNIKRIGLLAGAGSLPIEFVNHAHEHGIEEIAVLGFKGQTPEEVKKKATYYEEIGYGQINKGINFFKSNGIDKILFLGWIEPKLTISNLKMDMRMIALAARTKDRRADSVIKAIINEAAKDGLTIIETTGYLSHILVEEGVITKKKPDKVQMDDIEFGKSIALASGGLDIGQSAIVHKHAVIAVEAMEGTDKCIKRAGEYSKGCVIVKMAKPKQDFRFDVPCFGPRTIESMVEAKAALLAVEAGKTFIIEREKTIKLANKHKIVIIGITK
jgi:DUF1009 family protein